MEIGPLKLERDPFPGLDPQRARDFRRLSPPPNPEHGAGRSIGSGPIAHQSLRRSEPEIALAVFGDGLHLAGT